jgi:hypothetical protein
MKKRLILFAALICLTPSLTLPLAAQTYVQITSGTTYTLKNFYDTTPLSVGDVVEFGYYTQATVTNPFAGTFLALSGGTITNTALTPTSNGLSTTQDTVTTIIGGDSNTGAGPGQFAYNLEFSTSTPNLPANNQIMSILFFNNSTVASSTAYGGASDISWLWSNSSSSLSFPLVYNMSDPGVTWLNGDVAYTGVPEPQTTALFLSGLVFLVALRRRVRLVRNRHGS